MLLSAAKYDLLGAVLFFWAGILFFISATATIKLVGLLICLIGALASLQPIIIAVQMETRQELTGRFNSTLCKLLTEAKFPFLRNHTPMRFFSPLQDFTGGLPEEQSALKNVVEEQDQLQHFWHRIWQGSFLFKTDRAGAVTNLGEALKTVYRWKDEFADHRH